MLKHSGASRNPIEAFSNRYGLSHLYLAQHAAFPLALTPDLLYRLWANFQCDINGKRLDIPWVAVADLLLSNLCKRVGYELYEINATIRAELLRSLNVNPIFGDQRISELADFLLAYVQHHMDNSDSGARSYIKAQEWTALAYVKPGEAVRELVMALHEHLELGNKAEQLRVASLVETLAEPLADFVPLLSYVRGMQYWVRGNMQKAAAQIKNVVGSESSVHILDMKLPVPDGVLEQIQERVTIHTNTSVSRVGVVGSVEFERLRKSDLKSVPVFVQALDNQWLPRSLLRQAMKEGGVTPAIERELTKLVRAEYIRALLNGEQIVINRSYLYNNPAISQDYNKKKSPEYLAFKALLEDGTIIPFLAMEESPTDKPQYDILERAFNRWTELCQEIRTHCIRLSWDSKENARLVQNKLSRRFHQYVVGLTVGDIDTYIQDLRLEPDTQESFRKLLVQMGQLCFELYSQDKLVTRNILYREFVTTGNNPAERRYDNSKPFAAEIKQLLDLSYNSNVSDALNGYLVTPVDSLPRTALQEWQQSVQRPTIIAKELLILLQGTTFDLVQRSLNVPSMDILQLHDVRAIRATEEWRGYIQNLQALLKHPEQFADGGASGVYQSYAALTQRITSLINQQPGKGSLLTSWTPSIELVFNIAGAILSYRFTEQGPQWRLRGKVAELVAGETAPVIGKFVIRDMAEEHPQQDLNTGIDFMHFQIPDVQEQWKEIEMEVRKLPGFQEGSTEPEEIDSIISYKEGLE